MLCMIVVSNNFHFLIILTHIRQVLRLKSKTNLNYFVLITNINRANSLCSFTVISAIIPYLYNSHLLVITYKFVLLLW